MMTFFGQRFFRSPLLLIAIANVIVVGIAFAVIGIDAETSSDLNVYYRPLATSLLEGRGLEYAPGAPATYQLPGYGVLLVPVYAAVRGWGISEAHGLALFTLLCTTLTSVFIAATARQLWGTRLAAFVAAALWITYPFGLWMNTQFNNEVPFLMVLYAGVWVLVVALQRGIPAYRLYLLTGILLGMATLIRATGIGMLPLAALAVVVVGVRLPLRARLIGAALILSGGLVTILPWQVWLMQNTSQFTFLAGNAGVRNLSMGMTAALASNRSDVFVTEDVEALKPELVLRRDEVRSVGDFTRVLWEEFQQQPLAMTRYFFVRIIQTWYSTSSGRYQEISLWVQLPYLLLFALALVRSWRWGGVRRRWLIVFSLFVLYFWGTSTITFSLLRYLIPGLGFWMILLPALIPHAVLSDASTAVATTTQSDAQTA